MFCKLGGNSFCNSNRTASPHPNNGIYFSFNRQRKDLIHLNILNMWLDLIKYCHQTIPQNFFNRRKVPTCSYGMICTQHESLTAKMINRFTQMTERASAKDYFLSIRVVVELMHRTTCLYSEKQRKSSNDFSRRKRLTSQGAAQSRHYVVISDCIIPRTKSTSS